MIKRQLIAIGLLAAAATLAYGAEAGKTDPATGKSCVRFFSSERTDTGLVRMHYRNTCADAFEIQIMSDGGTRSGSIKAGTAKKPASVSITCKSSDECDRAEWKYE